MKVIDGIKNATPGIKASIAFFFASVITSGVSYIVTPIYTRILSPEVYGQTTVFMTWVNVFGIVAMFCLSYGVFNNGMVDYPDKRDEYSFSMLVLSNIITTGFTVLLLLSYPMIRSFVGIDLPLIILMCVLFFVQPAYNFWTAKQRYELKYKWTVLWTIFSAIASPSIAIISILLFNSHQLYARLFGAEVTLIIIYAIFGIYLACKARWRVETKYWKTAVLFNLPLIPHYLSTYLLGNSNKLLISNILGDEPVAYYSVAHSVATIITIVWSAINATLIPYTYEKCKSRDFKSISEVTIPILMLFGGLALLVTMFAPEVVAIMATSEYQEAIYVIPPIIGGVFFQVQYFIYANIVYYYKKPIYVMYASVISVILNFVLGYYMIKEFGYLAAGYATLICYFLQATLDYFAMRKVVGRNVYNMRYIGLLSMLVVVVALFSNFLYNCLWIRYGIIVIILIFCLIYRKAILKLVKSMRL